ncbi:MAG TPA: endonuclease [Flavobacteriaceae bacterium]|nr:endonuclease [Flavobacteriaceae bacterium]
MMKNITLFLFVLLTSLFVQSQQPYYTGIDFSLNEQELYDQLQDLVSIHVTSFNYGDARDILVYTDENHENINTVLLIYGYNDNDGNCTTDRSRSKNDFGGNSCQYNREHIFPRSLSVPDMGNANNSATGIVADPHNLRASDQQMNNNRGDKKFRSGSGSAGPVGSGAWYPGDEWKGDVARMIMYMYLRYGEQCLPEYVGEGIKQGNTEMLQLFLTWNSQDPVSQVEDQRNEFLESVYGNRNPFIDNPFLATKIWGGTPAEDRWNLHTVSFQNNKTVVYPNPALQNYIYVDFSQMEENIEKISLIDTQGKTVLSFKHISNSTPHYKIENIPSGFYFVNINTTENTFFHKLIVK